MPLQLHTNKEPAVYITKATNKKEYAAPAPYKQDYRAPDTYT
jgi:hypothetical protein